MVGAHYRRHGLVYEAEAHFVRGTKESQVLLAALIWEWQQLGQHEDPGYFLCRSLLLHWVHGQDELARVLLAEYFKHFTDIKTTIALGTETVYMSPHDLLNFAQLIHHALHRRCYPVFNTLVTQYQSALRADSFLSEVI